MLLIIISNLYLGAESKASAVSIYQTVKDFQHGSFAGAVIADESYPFPALNVKGNIGEQSLSGKSFG